MRSSGLALPGESANGAGVRAPGIIAAVRAATWLVRLTTRALSSSLVNGVAISACLVASAARCVRVRMIGSKEEMLNADQCPE